MKKTGSPSASRSQAERTRAMGILARSLYRELGSQGFEQKDVVELATALLGEVTDRKPIDPS
jgi:hypothetical protein